jgi:hypothetical protein
LRAHFSIPGQLKRCFNWKVALLSAVSRGALFFAVTASAGWRAATAAMSVEFLFRAVTSGFDGALSEALREARPAWLAALFIGLAVPWAENVLEYGVHYLHGTANLAAGAAASLAGTAAGSLFNWYAMRRGALLTGGESKPLFEDLLSIPRIAVELVLAVSETSLRLLSTTLARTKPLPQATVVH